nr:MAG TPA: hypothetical protein [Caudoviricetes sp.]DAP31331.1 MAG TPA: hypothetical protein [Caudoviricetes sp.]
MVRVRHQPILFVLIIFTVGQHQMQIQQDIVK